MIIIIIIIVPSYCQCQTIYDLFNSCLLAFRMCSASLVNAFYILNEHKCGHGLEYTYCVIVYCIPFQHYRLTCARWLKQQLRTHDSYITTGAVYISLHLTSLLLFKTIVVFQQFSIRCTTVLNVPKLLSLDLGIPVAVNITNKMIN